MKKILSLVLAATMVLSLAACGNTKSNNDVAVGDGTAYDNNQVNPDGTTALPNIAVDNKEQADTTPDIAVDNKEQAEQTTQPEQPTNPSDIVPEEPVKEFSETAELYKEAILNACSEAENTVIITHNNHEANEFLRQWLGVSEDIIEEFAFSFYSNEKVAYAVFAAKPVAGSEGVIDDAVNMFMASQKMIHAEDAMNMAIINNAQIGTTENGVIIMVMTEEAGDIFDTLKSNIESIK